MQPTAGFAGGGSGADPLCVPLSPLPLDSPRWSQLVHAFGPASDVPAAIADLASSGTHAWESLWSSVHHQGTVYDSTYAVVPHVIEMALAFDGPISWHFLAFPASVEIHRFDEGAATLPSDLELEYRSAISRLPAVVGQQLEYEWDHVFGQAAAAALLIVKGQRLLGEAILELGPKALEEFSKWWFGPDSTES